MMQTNKSRNGGDRAASRTTSSKHPIGSIQQRQRLPAYARELVEAQRRGFTVRELVISIGWRYGFALPRVCVPDGVDIDGLDLAFVRKLDCMVAHDGEPVRALAVAKLALQKGANRCVVIDVGTCKSLTTADVRAVLELEVAA